MLLLEALDCPNDVTNNNSRSWDIYMLVHTTKA